MKQILKNNTYAIEYSNWEKKLAGKKHAKYDANYKYHKDVLFELLLCQGGLCAYTEFRLIDQFDLETIKKEFINGKYVGNRNDLPIDVEHFDSRLKLHFGWRWSNLFAVYDMINQKVKRREEAKLIKQGKSVHDIMKPDLIIYNPQKILSYEPISNQFVPNYKLKPKEKEQVTEMILCLGLNNGFIKMKRREYYNELDVRIKLGEKVIPNQFLTGWEMR